LDHDSLVVAVDALDLKIHIKAIKLEEWDAQWIHMQRIIIVIQAEEEWEEVEGIKVEWEVEVEWVDDTITGWEIQIWSQVIGYVLAGSTCMLQKVRAVDVAPRNQCRRLEELLKCQIGFVHVHIKILELDWRAINVLFLDQKIQLLYNQVNHN
jgi:hypothetical protein